MMMVRFSVLHTPILHLRRFSYIRLSYIRLSSTCSMEIIQMLVFPHIHSEFVLSTS